MSGERLPGLQLAVKLLAQIGDDDSDRAIVAVHDLAEERTNTAAHVASIARQLGDEALQVDDIAVRVLGLAAEADKAERSLIRLEEERDTLRAKYGELLVALHGIGAALGIPEGDRSPYSITCGVLERVNRLDEIETQEPACWAVIDPIGGSSVEYTAAWREACHDHIGDMITEADMPEAANFLVRPLYARPAPAQLPDMELVSAKVHQAWMETKLAQGIHSRPAADGTEQMVPYESLPDALQELDRSTVRAVYAAIEQAAAAPEHKA